MPQHAVLYFMPHAAAAHCSLFYAAAAAHCSLFYAAAAAHCSLFYVVGAAHCSLFYFAATAHCSLFYAVAAANVPCIQPLSFVLILTQGLSWARICKRLRSPVIDSKDTIPPAYVAWRTGTSNRVVVPARQAGNRFLDSLKDLQIRALLSASLPLVFPHAQRTIVTLPRLIFYQLPVRIAMQLRVIFLQLSRIYEYILYY